MLGDAARFARDDIGLAQRVEQRGFAVIDMAHDRHDGRTRLQVFGAIFDAAEYRFRYRLRRRA